MVLKAFLDNSAMIAYVKSRFWFKDKQPGKPTEAGNI